MSLTTISGEIQAAALNANFSYLENSINSISVNVLDFGAKGDGVTDDTVAINAAIAYAKNIEDSVLLFPSATGFCTTDTITIDSAINIEMHTAIIYIGSDDIPALVIGSNADTFSLKNLALKVKRNTLSTWSNENNIGIKFININYCNICIVEVWSFTIGAQFMGSTAKGCSYNNITSNLFRGNKVALDITNELNGWCNENNLYGGRYSVGTENPTLSRYGIRITSVDGIYSGNNNNIFYKPCFELGTPTAGESVPILLEYAVTNDFKTIRSESSLLIARISNTSRFNSISIGTLGSGSALIEDLSSYPTTTLKLQSYKFEEDINIPIFNSGPMHKTACFYNGNSSVNVPSVAFFRVATSSWGGALPSSYSANTTYIYANYIECVEGLGVFVNTELCKTFAIRADAEYGYGGRVNIKCFDSSGNVLTDAGTGHPYVKSTNRITWIYSINQAGGAYGTTVDKNGIISFTVGADVKSIAIILRGGTSHLKIRSFTIFTNNNTNGNFTDNYIPSVWSGYEEMQNGINIGTAAPTGGTWKVGRRVLNHAPQVGQPKAWVCTTSGTLGTLNSGLTTGSIVSGTKTLTVNSITDMDLYQFVTISGVAGIKQIMSISGLTVTIDTNANATVTSAAVAFSPATFTSEGNL